MMPLKAEKSNHMKPYLLNCFLLLIPVLAWNILFFNALPAAYSPEIFWDNIPKVVGYSENVLRIIVFVLPALMQLSLKTQKQQLGLLIYCIGLIVYFLSWSAMIWWPESNWSQSLLGFTAPAYTTIIWLAGIAWIGHKSFVKGLQHPTIIYMLFSVLFVTFHTIHAFMVFQRGL